LRAELPDLTRGDRTEPVTRTHLMELDALSAAIGRFAQDVRARERTSEQERTAITHLLEAGTEGLLEVNEALRIVYVNLAARVLLGFPADARGQPITALVRQAELRDLIVRAVSGETPEAREVSLDERHLVVSCRPAPSGSGAVVTILDFTDIRFDTPTTLPINVINTQGTAYHIETLMLMPDANTASSELQIVNCRHNGVAAVVGPANGCPQSSTVFYNSSGVNDTMVVNIQCAPANRVGAVAGRGAHRGSGTGLEAVDRRAIGEHRQGQRRAEHEAGHDTQQLNSKRYRPRKNAHEAYSGLLAGERDYSSAIPAC
jgi:hypothetical protein